MLWSKQYYLFEVDKWLEEHGVDPMQQATTRQVRNREWFHMINAHVISMPPPSSNRGSRGSGCHSFSPSSPSVCDACRSSSRAFTRRGQAILAWPNAASSPW